jgi:hypothetical protein
LTFVFLGFLPQIQLDRVGPHTNYFLSHQEEEIFYFLKKRKEKWEDLIARFTGVLRNIYSNCARGETDLGLGPSITL